jgi:hypothetical protein
MLNAWTLLSRRLHASGGGGGGGGGSSILIQNADVSNLLAQCGIIFRTDGVVQYDDDGINIDYTYSSTPTDFEIRATLISGTAPVGTFGSWLSLGSIARSWYYAASGAIKNCLITFEARRVSDFVVVETASVSLTYENGA